MTDIIQLFQNVSHTVGIIEIPEKANITRLPGYLNKNLLAEMMAFLDLCENRDLAVYYREKDGASVLLFSPDERSDVFIAVAGMTERSE
jgi:hypothetical protein